MKVIIAGGRKFDDYDLLCKVCDHALSLQLHSDIEIVSGAADGADLLGEKYASDKNYALMRFPADWKKYGKSAGYRRNDEMAKYADALIAFWDGKSKGTKNMIDKAKLNGLKVKIVKY